MGQEVILVDHKLKLWFDFGKKLEAAKEAKLLNPGSELVYDDAYDDWWDWQWEELTFCGCIYVEHDRCRHGLVLVGSNWPARPADTPEAVIARGIKDGHIDEDALDEHTATTSVKVTF